MKKKNAVLIRAGNDTTIEGGHYTAYRIVADEWYFFDDAKVKRVPQHEMLGKAITSAVMLMYNTIE